MPEMNISSGNGIQTTTTNSLWQKVIPRINKVFLVLSLIFFGWNLIIKIFFSRYFTWDWWDWYIILILGVFGILFLFENFSLRKKFGSVRDSHDLFVAVVILIRNTLILFNFHEEFVLFGILWAPITGAIIIVLYGGFIMPRLASIKKTTLE